MAFHEQRAGETAEERLKWTRIVKLTGPTVN
jgi:hypothetical protein